jgi:carnitine 3-dehydrogenase|tara:strand:- start:3943 stop:5448 length:1506 start_codon:yes stop_codon:yes gene_type:complete
MAFVSAIKKVAIVGTGVIGAGWAARCLAHGLDVVAWDPAPGAEARLRAAVANAWPALQRVGLWPGASLARLSFVSDLALAVKDADFVQENAPEREDLKRQLHRDIDQAVRPDVIVASSSSGLLPTAIQQDCRHPERVIIGHPFNPVYLLPLVELVAGQQTDDGAIALASDFYRTIGMKPLKVRKEIEGYLSDRLQEALWREVLHLVNDDIADTGELDDAIIYGPGLRWALMGTNMTFHLAGGDSGMRHMLEQFGPALKLPWTKLEAPELTDSLIDKMVDGTQKQAAGRSVKELEQLRDNCLISVMQALRQFQHGAGQVLAEDEAGRYTSRRQPRWTAGTEIGTPLKLYDCDVQMSWLDYNGHMTEASYLTAFGDATDALFRFIGDDEAYRASGYSFYTVETHINNYQEVRGGEPLVFTTQLLGVDDKRLYFYHEMFHGRDGTRLASTEQLLLHVDMAASKACPIEPQVKAALDAIWDVHRDLPRPDGAGRTMAVKGAKALA